MVTTLDGFPIAAKSVRVVHGGRGDYLEIADQDMLMDNLTIPDDQAWRLTEKWQDKVYYYWFVPIGHPDVKLYLQRRTVNYADYKVGMWYVNPALVEET